MAVTLRHLHFPRVQKQREASKSLQQLQRLHCTRPCNDVEVGLNRQLFHENTQEGLVWFFLSLDEREKNQAEGPCFDESRHESNLGALEHDGVQACDEVYGGSNAEDQAE